MKQIKFITVDTQNNKGEKAARILCNSLSDGYRLLNVTSAGEGLICYLLEKEDYEV